ncbi:MAG: hypothetical protein ACRC33_01365 [Gemmataceae bacterium]
MRRLTLATFAALAVAAATSAGPADDGATDLKTEVQALRDEIAVLRKLRDLDLRTLADRLDRIEKMLERGPSRSAFTPTAAGRGVVRLDNRLPVTGYATIDGIAYAVPPLSTRTVRDVAVGPISYTLGGDGLATGPTTLSRVNAGERLTITILPPG